MKKLIALAILFLLSVQTSYADLAPRSSSYQIVDYGFGAGGANSGSSAYSLFGTLGDTSVGSLSSSLYNIGAGLEFTLMATAPAAPTFVNDGSTYDRLKITLNPQGFVTDTQFAIMISPDDYQTIHYVQSDGTIGSVLGDEDFLTYTSWGGASGSYITGLSQNTTYKVRVKARHGAFTEGRWGAQASAVTSQPSLTFGVDQATITFNNLNSGNSYTDSSQSTVLTTSTNAYNGYVVTGYTTQPLTLGATTINEYASPNSTPTSWAGYGFGYTTNDSNLTGGTANRFTSGGPNFAGFTNTAPGDPVADHAGPVTNAISNEQFTISYRVTTTSTQTAGEYTTTVIYIVTPEY